MNKYFQSLLRSSHRRPVSRVLKGHQRSSAPTAGDLRKEPVLDGIELGTIRRIMNDKKPDTQFVGKVHKILLDDSVRTGVRASAIAQDNQSVRSRVLLLQVLPPYPCDVVTDKLGRVMADAQCHVTDIPGHIIDAVRNNLTIGECGEVMIICQWLAIGKGLSFPLEVSEHLLLLGVNADDGKSHRLCFFADGGDTLELFISVLDLFHRKVLIERAFPKAKGVKDLADEVAGDIITGLGQFIYDLRHAQGYPHYIFVLRKTCGMGLDDLHNSPRPLGMLGKHALPTGTRSANAAVTRTLSGEKFLSPILKSMCACSHNFTNFAVAEPMSLEVGGLGCQEPSSVSFVQRGHIRQIAWRKDFWRSFRKHFYTSWSLYKVTKKSPDFLYYIIDNQQIKSIIYRFFGDPRRGGYSSARAGSMGLPIAA